MKRLLAALFGVGLLVFLALLPELQIDIPGVLPGPTWTPGTLQLLAVCLLVGALAVSYDLLFGMTGLLSFGHALYFAIGVYGFTFAVNRWHLSIGPAALATLAIGTVVALIAGLISLRVTGIAFAMVTLAFAQAGSLFVYRNIGGFTGGEEGIGLNSDGIPDALVGVVNTDHLYWLSLGIAAAVFLAVTWLAGSRAGRVMAAVRENDLRVAVLGLRPYVVRLVAFVSAGTLATLCGMGYLLLQGGANPQVTTSSFTLSLLIMVVLGGVGSRWGAMLGGFVYTLLDQRLTVFSSSSQVASLPAVFRVPLSQPLFLLGTLFVLVVLFLPGGFAGTVTRLRHPIAANRAVVEVSGGNAEEPVSAR